MFTVCKTITDRTLTKIGRLTNDLLAGVGKVCNLFLQSCSAIINNTIFWKNTIDQMDAVGVKSLPIVLIISTFTGMVFSLQIAKVFATFGLSSQLGQGLTLAFARELAPVLTGVVVAGRVGSSIAAEIGSMKVTEQIDALETLSTSPIDYLVAPRILAGSLMMPILVIFADIVGILGGFLVAVSYAKIPPNNFIDGILTFIKPWDFIGGIIKSFFFGMVIAGIGTYKGLATENGAVGVGKATTQAVVVSIIIIFILNYFMSMFLYQL
ncbi:MAG TPA: ABC transporter permease [Bacillota bacterium]|jgi:phospholipid/cholesterol/gamma-HCH transport system permease protein|nr:ABC transporter permease [Bacillota bacterium]HOL10813.1 ABC transporter permease [Bacillota bacterium]HPO98507.1 ABC transporter permease [Bacillota bacterium]